MSDIVERLRNYIPGEHEEFVPEVNALAIAEIETLRRQLDIAITALRRIGSLAEKNVTKYAREIASEGLRHPVGQQPCSGKSSQPADSAGDRTGGSK